MAISNSDFARSSSGSPIGKVDVDPPSTTAVNDSDVVFTDITTGNASATKHGFLKKLSNVATEFLNGAGNFVTLAQSSITDLVTDLAGKEATANKDATGGYAGLTLFKINFKNVANTFTSFFTNSNTAARTYTFQDRNGTIIDDTNLVTGSTDNAILRADGTGGKTSQSSGVTIDDNNNIVLPTTATASTTGIIYKGTKPFIHNYQTTGTTGQNIFIGLDSGNFTMTGSSGSQSSNNVAIGKNTLDSLTTGYGNVCIGVFAGTLMTTGIQNFCLGDSSFTKVTTGGANTGVGAISGRYVTGNNNTFVGNASGQGVNGSSTGSKNTAVGRNSLYAITTGTGNIAIGDKANEITSTGSDNIIIGSDIDPSSATASNEINIGGRIFAGRTGSPESVVTAGIGSMYLQADGGAGTTLWIKESGTGNTGWISK